MRSAVDKQDTWPVIWQAVGGDLACPQPLQVGRGSKCPAHGCVSRLVMMVREQVGSWREMTALRHITTREKVRGPGRVQRRSGQNQPPQAPCLFQLLDFHTLYPSKRPLFFPCPLFSIPPLHQLPSVQNLLPEISGIWPRSNLYHFLYFLRAHVQKMGEIIVD